MDLGEVQEVCSLVNGKASLVESNLDKMTSILEDIDHIHLDPEN